MRFRTTVRSSITPPPGPSCGPRAERGGASHGTLKRAAGRVRAAGVPRPPTPGLDAVATSPAATDRGAGRDRAVGPRGLPHVRPALQARSAPARSVRRAGSSGLGSVEGVRSNGGEGACGPPAARRRRRAEGRRVIEIIKSIGKSVVLLDRIELSTSSLPMRCSTTELQQRVVRGSPRRLRLDERGISPSFPAWQSPAPPQSHRAAKFRVGSPFSATRPRRACTPHG